MSAFLAPLNAMLDFYFRSAVATDHAIVGLP
jgi:hypothetical protein